MNIGSLLKAGWWLTLNVPASGKRTIGQLAIRSDDEAIVAATIASDVWFWAFIVPMELSKRDRRGPAHGLFLP